MLERVRGHDEVVALRGRGRGLEWPDVHREPQRSRLGRRLRRRLDPVDRPPCRRSLLMNRPAAHPIPSASPGRSGGSSFRVPSSPAPWKTLERPRDERRCARNVRAVRTGIVDADCLLRRPRRRTHEGATLASDDGEPPRDPVQPIPTPRHLDGPSLASHRTGDLLKRHPIGDGLDCVDGGGGAHGRFAAFRSTRLGDQVAARGARECADSSTPNLADAPHRGSSQRWAVGVKRSVPPHAQTPGPPLRLGRLRRLALPHSGGTALRRAETRKVLIDITDGELPASSSPAGGWRREDRLLPAG